VQGRGKNAEGHQYENAGGGGLAVVEAAPAPAVDGAALACPVDPVEAWLGQPIRWLV